MKFHEAEAGRTVDIAVTIQPTTPFFTTGEIDRCVELLMRNPDMDSAFSLAPVPERPEWMFSRDARGRLTPYVNESIQGDCGVSQTLVPLYHPNGGVYATRRQTQFDDGLLIGPKAGGWVMSRLRSVDIDDPVDVLVAEAVAAYLADHLED